jgi:hypothetical protein
MVHIPSEPSSYDEAFKKVAPVREGRHKLADSMWRCKQKAGAARAVSGDLVDHAFCAN